GSLKNIIESRAWWPSMDYDLCAFVSACPNCQTHQRHRSTQEREEHQVVSDPFIQPFQRWGIDLIGILPETPSGNRWIITAVDYATGWPIAKAVKKATKDVIAEFIYDEIYMHFGAPQEIFTDGERISGLVVFSGIGRRLGRSIREQVHITHERTAKSNRSTESSDQCLGNCFLA